MNSVWESLHCLELILPSLFLLNPFLYISVCFRWFFYLFKRGLSFPRNYNRVLPNIIVFYKVLDLSNLLLHDRANCFHVIFVKRKDGEERKWEVTYHFNFTAFVYWSFQKIKLLYWCRIYEWSSFSATGLNLRIKYWDLTFAFISKLYSSEPWRLR